LVILKSLYYDSRSEKYQINTVVVVHNVHTRSCYKRCVIIALEYLYALVFPHLY